MSFHHLKVGEPVDLTDRLLPTLKVGYQKPPETVSEVEKLKIFLGEHFPRSPQYKQLYEHYIITEGITTVLTPL